ncbi:thermonuclease family protein [Variovorax sp. J31P207]|uniref:thermonuclease family protein n=1 Tax=Variovorax sp. J31P207 TaxID=3053510 RepID=UPI0025759B9A|nr:thermonuclease family protein [Variovorax sp. J31P207]MDM0070587.1 thermonuclease family protein [Variovorax sp. J31P207]
MRNAFGNVSRLSLAQMVAGRQVSVESVESEKTDRYGRTVGVVFAGGRDVNRQQIERGLAWWCRAYLSMTSLLPRAPATLHRRRSLAPPHFERYFLDRLTD